MNKRELIERKLSLENDLRRSKQAVSMLIEQLDAEKAQFHSLGGHHHEVCFQLECLTAKEA